MTVTHAHAQSGLIASHTAKHRDHLCTTNQKADIISEFLLVLAEILPSIINKEKKRNMMGTGRGASGQTQASPEKSRHK